MTKMTPWFPAHIKPVRAGVYEVRTPNSKENKYAYYDHRGWRLCSNRIDYAEQEKHYTSSTNTSYSSMVLVGSKWRGFTKEQI